MLVHFLVACFHKFWFGQTKTQMRLDATRVPTDTLHHFTALLN